MQKIPCYWRTSMQRPSHPTASASTQSCAMPISLAFRGLAAIDSGQTSLIARNLAFAAKNAGPVSGLAKPFPGRNWQCSAETGSNLVRDGFESVAFDEKGGPRPSTGQRDQWLNQI